MDPKPQPLGGNVKNFQAGKKVCGLPKTSGGKPLRKLAVSRNWKPCPILPAAAVVVPPRLPVLSRLLPGTGLSRPAASAGG
jgi:hypothetical protein